MTHYSRQLLHLEAVLASKLKQVSLLKKEHQLLQHKEKALTSAIQGIEGSLAITKEALENAALHSSAAATPAQSADSTSHDCSSGAPGKSEGGACSPRSGCSRLSPSNSSGQSGPLQSHGGPAYRDSKVLLQHLASREGLVQTMLQQLGCCDNTGYKQLYSTELLHRAAADPARAVQYLSDKKPDRLRFLSQTVSKMALLVSKYDSSINMTTGNAKAQLDKLVDDLLERIFVCGLWDPPARYMSNVMINMDTHEFEPYPEGFWRQVVQALKLTPAQKAAMKLTWDGVRASTQQLTQQYDQLQWLLQQVHKQQLMINREFEAEMRQLRGKHKGEQQLHLQRRRQRHAERLMQQQQQQAQQQASPLLLQQQDAHCQQQMQQLCVQQQQQQQQQQQLCQLPMPVGSQQHFQVQLQQQQVPLPSLQGPTQSQPASSVLEQQQQWQCLYEQGNTQQALQKQQQQQQDAMQELHDAWQAEGILADLTGSAQGAQVPAGAAEACMDQMMQELAAELELEQLLQQQVQQLLLQQQQQQLAWGNGMMSKLVNSGNNTCSNAATPCQLVSEAAELGPHAAAVGSTGCHSVLSPTQTAAQETAVSATASGSAVRRSDGAVYSNSSSALKAAARQYNSQLQEAEEVLLQDGSNERQELERRMQACTDRIKVVHFCQALQISNTLTKKQLATMFVHAHPFVPEAISMMEAMDEIGWD